MAIYSTFHLYYRYILTPPQPSPAVAHGGNHAICFNGGNLRNAMAPQDRAALRLRGGCATARVGCTESNLQTAV